MTHKFDFELYGVWTSHQKHPNCEVYHHKPDCIVMIHNTAEVIEYRPSQQLMLMKPDAVPLTQHIIQLTSGTDPYETFHHCDLFSGGLGRPCK